MIEIIAIVVSVVGGVGTVGTVGYKCYKTCKEKDKPDIVINQNLNNSHNSFKQDILDRIIMHEVKKERKSGDSETSVDIKISIHTHEDEKE